MTRAAAPERPVRRRAGSSGRSHQAPRSSAEIRLLESSILFAGGRPAEAAAVAHDVRTSLPAPDDLAAAVDRAELLGLLGLGDVERLWAPAERILSGTAPSDDREAIGAALIALGHIAWDDGRVASALGFLGAAVRRTEHGGRHPGNLCHWYSQVCLARALIAVEEIESAERVIADIADGATRFSSGLWIAAATLLRARLRLATGELEMADAQARRGLREAEHLATDALTQLAWFTLAECALLRGDIDDATQWASQARPEPSHGAGFGVASVDYVEARCAEIGEGPSRAVALLVDVCDALPRHKRLLVEEPASGPWLVGVALANGDQARAEMLAVALEQVAAENRGLASLASRAKRSRALVVGASSSEEDRGCSPVTGWTSLTSQEQRVAVFAAYGLSNRQIADRIFLSRHTVDFHLRHVYRKLEMHSRVELAHFVFEREDVA